MSQVFISYAREDKEFVERLTRDLEAGGFDVWVDRDDLEPGDSWVAAISRAIESCSFFVIVITSFASNSKTVSQELFLADMFDKQIFPLLLQTCVAPPNMKLLLGSRQWIDFEGDYAGGTQRLLAALGKRQPQPTPGPVPGPGGGNSSNIVFPNQPPHAQPPLLQVLPGKWSGTATFMGMPPVNFTLWIGPEGSFSARMATGESVQGRWGLNFGTQVVLQGADTSGMVSRPFNMLFNVTQYGPHQINGFGANGEGLVWRRF